jgi:hypothetical protein
MSTDDAREARIDARIDVGGDLAGQVAVGQDVRQSQMVVAHGPPTPEELAALDQRFRELAEMVDETAPDERRREALARVGELEAAVRAEEPDLTTMEYVRNWFARNLPSVAGAVTSVIVNPIVGKLVAAAGDSLVAEFRRRFGPAAAP